MTATALRDQAITLVKTNPEAALRLARTIDDPWFRSQALAWVARWSNALPLLKEARAASYAADDPYRIVGSSAWWLRAMIELGDETTAAREAWSIVELSSKIEHPVSRLHALCLIFEALFVIEAARNCALGAMVAAARAATSWKAGYILSNAVWLLVGTDRAQAERVIESMPEGKYKRKATRTLEAGNKQDPRPFFW